MKHIKELAEIYNLLDIVESRIDPDVIRKDKATCLMIALRAIIASTFKALENLE